jgi:hypothetical protein
MGLGDGIAFQVFQTIERVVKEPIVDLSGAIETMRSHLLSAEWKKFLHLAELRKNWFFLECAIRSAVRDSTAPRGSLPFRIFAEYSGRSTAQIGSDSVIADAQRLLSDDGIPDHFAL